MHTHLFICCKFSLVVDLEFRVVMSSIPYMGMVVLANVFIKSGIVDPNVYGGFDCPGEAMPLPAYYDEVFHSNLIVSVVLVAIYRGWCFEVLPASFL